MATDTRTEITPEDLLLIDDRPMPELVDGELLVREMGQKSDSIALRIARYIGNHVEDHDLGLVNGSQGSYQVFPDDPGKVRIPDVSFTRRDRLPPGGAASGHSRVVPDLIVEVVSPNDTFSSVQSKVNDYLGVDVPLIWILDPETLSVQVHRRDRSGTTLFVGDILDGEGVLPGFRCEVAKLFA